MKKALAPAAVLIAVAAAITALLAHRQKQPSVKRGSPTVEFVPRERPHVAAPALAWPAYGYDLARDHVAPAAFKLRPPFRRIWAVNARFLVEFPPSVGYGNVYVAQLKGRLFAVDARRGRVVWNRSYAPYCTFSSPTLAHGVLYQTFLPPPCDYGDRGKSGLVVAVDARTGRELWRLRGPASESAVLYRKGTIYFGAWDHHLYALDVRTRRPRVRWRFTANGELNSSPAYAGGTVYIGSRAGRFYAVDARTGRERWHADGTEDFYAAPAIAYGRVFVGNTDGTVYAFGAATGHALWRQHAGTYVYTAAAVWHRTVFVGSYDGNVYALDAATGDVEWKRDLGASIHGAPTVLSGLVYFSTCGRCGYRGSRYAKRGPRATFALDPTTGRIVWRFRDGHYSPVVADAQRMYLMGDSTLYAFAPARS